MYILVPVWLQVLQGLALLPFAISVFLLVRQQNRRQEDIDARSRLGNARLQDYMSSQAARLAETLIMTGNCQRLLESLCMHAAGQSPAPPAPAPESTPTPAEFVGQLTPIQLSILLRSLGMQSGVELPSFLQVAGQPQLPESPPEGLVEDPSQEPEISHGGE